MCPGTNNWKSAYAILAIGKIRSIKKSPMGFTRIRSVPLDSWKIFHLIMDKCGSDPLTRNCLQYASNCGLEQWNDFSFEALVPTVYLFYGIIPIGDHHELFYLFVRKFEFVDLAYSFSVERHLGDYFVT